MSTKTIIDEDRLKELIETATVDVGAVAYAPLAIIGDRLGLYDTLAEYGPLTSSELADRTDTAERYVREWLAASAASEYVSYEPETERYSLSPEQALLLADTAGPATPLAGLFQLAFAAGKAMPKIERAFRTGEGVGWHEHDGELFEGMVRASELDFKQRLVSDWIPALDEIDEKLQEGARVADIGCGYGEAIITMAKAYPNSMFVGVDYHEESIKAARERAATEDVADNVSFEIATAKDYEDGEYDLVTSFDSLHDMGDPVGVAKHVRETLADDGTWLIVELLAGDRVEENLQPRGRMFYSFSTMLCTPNALAQEGHHALGTQAGEERLREVVTEGGFTEFRRVIDSPPFKMVLEAKP